MAQLKRWIGEITSTNVSNKSFDINEWSIMITNKAETVIICNDETLKNSA